MRILIYILIILFGSFIGFKRIVSKRIFSKLNTIQYICLLFLLFVMGIKIGTNKEVLLSFHQLGLSALVITIFSIIFSLIGIHFISKIFNSTQEREDK